MPEDQDPQEEMEVLNSRVIEHDGLIQHDLFLRYTVLPFLLLLLAQEKDSGPLTKDPLIPTETIKGQHQFCQQHFAALTGISAGVVHRDSLCQT